MQLARVVGEVVATIKDPNLSGMKLLVLQPMAATGESAGRTLVALDSVGAGVGEAVFFVRGREAAFPFYPGEPPADATIIGIVDQWDVEESSKSEVRSSKSEVRSSKAETPAGSRKPEAGS